MNRKKWLPPEKWILTGIPALFISGSILHFLYDLSGKNVIAGLFAPVNESVWEHTKMVLLPTILWWLLYYIFCKKEYYIKKSNWFEGTLAALITALISVPALYYFYTGAFGASILWIDILILLLSFSFGQLLGLHVYQYGKGRNPKTVLAIFIGILLLFALLTFFPPKLPLFQDPGTLKLNPQQK